MVAKNADSEKKFATAMARDVPIIPLDYAREVVSTMLKITQDAEVPEIVRVSLCGRFTGEYVPEVEKALVQGGDKSKKCALDLVNVTFVDRPAMEFLTRAKSRNIRIDNLPSYVTRWMQQEAANGSSSSGAAKK